jgi:hypothetical protein
MLVTRRQAHVYLRRNAPGHIPENVAVTLTIAKRQYGEGIPLFGDGGVKVALASRLYDLWFEGSVLRRPWVVAA